MALYRIVGRGLSTETMKAIQMPTPLSLGHGLQFHCANTDETKKPIAVVVGWMGAKQSQMKPYLSFYHNVGIDTISFAVGPRHVLFPKSASAHMKNVLDITIEKIQNGNDTRDVIFHCFSMGGFLYGQSLRAITENPAKYGTLKRCIKAQIFDSPPDRGAIANGVAKSMGYGGVVEKAVGAITRGLLSATASTSGVEHQAASDAFHGNTISAPALWYYSRADPVARWEDCEIVMNKWRARGTSVDSLTWEDSPHIQHGRKYPQEYFGKLREFLTSNKLIV